MDTSFPGGFGCRWPTCIFQARDKPYYIDAPLVMRSGLKFTADAKAEVRLKPGTNRLTIRDTQLLCPFPADYRLLELGPKSMPHKGAPGTDPPRWTELFSPDLVCTLHNVSVTGVRSSCSRFSLGAKPSGESATTQ